LGCSSSHLHTHKNGLMKFYMENPEGKVYRSHQTDSQYILPFSANTATKPASQASAMSACPCSNFPALLFHERPTVAYSAIHPLFLQFSKWPIWFARPIL